MAAQQPADYGYRVKDAASGGHSFSGHVETDLVARN
jgi:hypothetical protein